MKLWVLSDIHVELTLGWDLPGITERPDFDVLVVAGDLMPHMERGVRWLAERVTDRPVIYVPGNHEAYHSDIDRTLEDAKDAARGSNIIVMENETIVIEGLRVIAGTLWTDFQLFDDPEIAMEVAGRQMNDYRFIRTGSDSRRLHPADTLHRHYVTRKYIDAELAKSDGPSVVVTHHAPYPGAARRGQEFNILSAAYVSDLTDLIKRRQPDVWIYGHTHQSDSIMIGRTHIVANPKGYGPHAETRRTTWDNADFDPTFVVDVPAKPRSP